MDIFELFPSAISIWTNEAFVQLWGTVVTWFNELLTSFIAMPIEKKIGQILGIIVTIGCIVIAQLPKRSQILTAQAFLNVVSAVNLLLVSDGMSGLTASLPCFVAVVHCSVNVIRERKNSLSPLWEKILFSILYFIAWSVGFTISLISLLNQGHTSAEIWKFILTALLPILAAGFFVASVFMQKEQRMRLCSLGNAGSYATYNLITQNTAIFAHIFTIISITIALIRYRKHTHQSK